MSKSSLIDLNAEMPTRAKTIGHAERLNERTPRNGDAIVRSASNYTKMQKLAEMTSSFERRVTRRKLEDFWMADITFDANLDNSQNLGKIFADLY